MYEIDPDRIDLAHEFRRGIYGRHSGELQRVLNRMRGGDNNGRYVLLHTVPGQFLLARMGARRGDPVTPVPDYVFHSVEEAEWTVFKLRWKELTGRDLAVD